MAGNRRDPNNITMYNVSKKLVSESNGSGQQVRFKYADAYDGYAGVTVPRNTLIESANPNFWHIRMQKNLMLTMSYKTGIRKDDVTTKEISPREFKDMFEKTRLPKQKKTKQEVRESQVDETLNGDGLLAEMQAQSAVHDFDGTFELPF